MDDMTEDKRKERNELDRLADALVDDILNASAEEILAETEDDGIDSAKLAGHMYEVFERAATEVGKAKLVAAKQSATEAQQKGVSVAKFNLADARRRYDATIAKDPILTEKLTLAARKGEGQSERDIDKAIEDLAELGAFNEQDADK